MSDFYKWLDAQPSPPTPWTRIMAKDSSGKAMPRSGVPLQVRIDAVAAKVSKRFAKRRK